VPNKSPVMKNMKTEEPGPVAPLQLLHHCSCYMFTLLLTMCCCNCLVLGVPEKPLACADVGQGSVSLNESTVSTTHTALLATPDHIINYRTQNSFLLKPDTWIDSSGKLLNLKCTHTTSTDKMA